MMHDIHELFNSRDSEELYWNFLSIKRVGNILIREGFRHLLIDQFKGDVVKMSKAFLVLNRIAKIDEAEQKHANMTTT